MTCKFTLVLCLLVFTAIAASAQSDSARFADYQGNYLISTSSFPVSDVTVYWKDSTLAYRAGGANGLFSQKPGDQWHFVNDDHQGTVTFKKNASGKVIGILIVMDGENYEGTKAKPGARNKQ